MGDAPIMVASRFKCCFKVKTVVTVEKISSENTCDNTMSATPDRLIDADGLMAHFHMFQIILTLVKML